MKQKLTTPISRIVTAVSAANLLLWFSAPVYALDCAVLPGEICSKAEDSEAIFASGDANSNRVAQAKTIMTNTTVGIIAFGLMYLALNWLIPGGIFN